MGQIIEELYFDEMPTNLYRHGSATSAQMHKPRTMPPRDAAQVHDLKIFEKNGESWVDHESGGISLFNKPNPRFGNRWWKLPKGTKIPPAFRVSRDKGINKITGQIHYTIRPMYDMPLATFVQHLKEFSKFAVPDFDVPKQGVK
ncbi:hypothetical protein [Teredinibacter sp. KSP-S5-2]|uniref:Tse2 family ADP-ribosyltransferase toxin n=1 Tax=Teredinibacter sp. KSP-S5-2 TaxID=3034506 RepID=UPI002934DE61|nr:hypothetical protein [Teredinibacter sp. KSP-S5-2]WNO08887.1 hypothetical protein P5V12_18105 [Teredinibacter sp. KSP-S5-2]